MTVDKSSRPDPSQLDEIGRAAHATADMPARRWPRRAAIASATVIVVVVATTTAGGWYYADELLLVDASPAEYPVEVLDVTGDTVTLTGTDADQPGLVGLEWNSGYARLGPEIARSGNRVIRPLVPFPDVPEAGTKARVDGYAFPSELATFRTVSTLDATEVHFPGPLGAYPATYVPGERDRWVIHVHGRGGNRAEAYRLVPAIHQLGYPQLSISYRNDDDAPSDSDGEYGLGWTESEDLAAAVAHARERGARDVVLVGYSMGGAVVGNYLRVHGETGIAGLIYDSPVLSWADVLAHESANRNLPGFAAHVASAVVRVRTGIDLGAMDQIRNADDASVPVLLFHGSADPTVPARSSDEYAAARPDIVTYIRPAGVGHVRSWNHDTDAYDAAVTDFLSSLR
ncbi:alpha/beta fold hydrolase [Actinobacteria bacterium YIM 96077]|uniref:Peptidase n=1 Tax=Phytoactinopolyspora halophila TaxID=1981511 RepID=A0A329QV76_9ACTN|nr:alpha/beta fold hydrolase [Phytoactinopolyspora halophila]AYY12867.1 alpha/beta fold hydrolase [Actinobacteria bacterium YIM 96077]RAW16340.1 peptidase [Phytoactinopolyspora halophila]